VLELGHRDVRRVEILRVGPQPHQGAGALFLDALGLQLLLQLAAFEGDAVPVPVAVHRDFEPLGKGVRDRDAHAVQAA
jgi:hypothetical protein